MQENKTPVGGAQEAESNQQKNSMAAPAINLPKGGGAIRGMGEKFAANPVTGTGSMSVPLAVSPGRAGFGPQLSLAYDSGSGNGPFGFGWSLSLPAITRKADKGLPQYRDDRDGSEEADVFILSGAEDLAPVPMPQAEEGEEPEPVYDEQGNGYRVEAFRPRIEGLFARIERWTKVVVRSTAENSEEPDGLGDVHWRSISKDNILTIYGPDSESRICDPADPGRIFSWLIAETRDDKGNAVIYEYKAEDSVDVDLRQAHEHNRGELDDPARTANRYPKWIKYGNPTPLLNTEGKRPLTLSSEEIEKTAWMFEVVFDYGEHDAVSPTPTDDESTPPWACRPDPFSSYRAGFEVRTYRLCQRVLIFHHIPDSPNGQEGYDGLVRSTDFKYQAKEGEDLPSNPIYSFLASVTQSGYQPDGNGYSQKSLPPLEFQYSRPVVQETVEDVDAASLENLPIGVDGSMYQWTDLHGEGIPGILTEQAGAWFYKRNLSPLSKNKRREHGDRFRSKEATGVSPVHFSPQEQVALKPNLSLAAGAQFMDLAGDGLPDLVVLDGPAPGLYEHDEAEGWNSFRPFTSRLNRSTRDPNLKFVDLDGDGHADILITEDDALVWHPSLGEAGFGPARRVAQALDEEKG
ncbi:MAG: toxin, partial [Candidatus Electrothrix sp. AR1]|nr:toxin [Candidatus Electrothrix sp. AR1]